MAPISKPEQAKCYITSLSLQARHSQKHILAWIDDLILKSASTGICVEDKHAHKNQYSTTKPPSPPIMPLTQASDILTFEGNQNWPNWFCQECIVMGSLKKDIVPIDLFFLYDCNPDNAYGHGDYDRFCQHILSHYDWAIFSYFTTYGSGLISFITNDEKLHEAVNAVSNLHIVKQYDLPYAGMAQLKTATFYDYDGQWLLPLLLAKERKEALPLLLCSIDLDESSYAIFDHMQAEYISGRFNYSKHTEKLTLIATWQRKPAAHYLPVTQFQVYEIIDLEAYDSLWARLSSGSIVDCVVSGDCDLATLKQYSLQQDAYHDLAYFIENHTLASWAYDCFYGGGADEHMGIFSAKDSQITEHFWQLLGQNAQRTIQSQLHSVVSYAPQECWQWPLLFSDEKPLILCQIGKAAYYRLWSDSEEEWIDNTVWYEHILTHLTLLTAFEVGETTYQIHVLDDEAAYAKLCDTWVLHPIVQAVFAPDCNVAALKKTLSEISYYSAEHLNQVASWMLSKYDDEGSIYFYAKKTENIQMFNDLLTKDSTSNAPQVSRF